jgi:preprotein translocase subunit YajC
VDSLTPLNLLAHAHLVAEATTAKKGGLASLAPLLIIGGLFFAFYVFAIKPQRKKQQEARAQASAATIGNKVLLAGGFVATIIGERDDEFDVQLSSDSTATVVKQAVLKVITPADSVEDQIDKSRDNGTDGSEGTQPDSTDEGTS